MTLAYLASPYSHPDPNVRQARFEAAASATVELFKRGHKVFSPIAYSHQIAITNPDAYEGFEFWKEFDLKMLDACDTIIVLMLDGWDESEGVTAEIKYGIEQEKKIKYITKDPATWQL